MIKRGRGWPIFKLSPSSYLATIGVRGGESERRFSVERERNEKKTFLRDTKKIDSSVPSYLHLIDPNLFTLTLPLVQTNLICLFDVKL